MMGSQMGSSYKDVWRVPRGPQHRNHSPLTQETKLQPCFSAQEIHSVARHVTKHFAQMVYVIGESW